MRDKYNLKQIFIENKNNNLKPIQIIINSIFVIITVLILTIIIVKAANIEISFNFIDSYKILIMKGFLTTIIISVGSFIFSLLFGIISSLSSFSRVIYIKYLSILYTTIIRGTPLITQIFLFYYIVGTALKINNVIFAGIIILSIFEGAYISEIIRGSYNSIDKTQIESARSIGLSKFQIFTHIILPQLTSRTLPALTGQLGSIIKDSSLLSIISIAELQFIIQGISNDTLNFFGTYIFLGILYLTLTLPVTLFSKLIEKRFNYENRN